jgi:hypothetical protein
MKTSLLLLCLIFAGCAKPTSGADSPATGEPTMMLTKSSKTCEIIKSWDSSQEALSVDLDSSYLYISEKGVNILILLSNDYHQVQTGVFDLKYCKLTVSGGQIVKFETETPSAPTPTCGWQGCPPPTTPPPCNPAMPGCFPTGH